MTTGYLQFDKTGRVSCQLHFGDNVDGSSANFEIPENFTASNEYALIDGKVTFIGPPPSVDHYWDGTLYALDVAQLQGRIKSQRQQLLAASDWTQLADVDAAVSALWLEYRKALRDITAQAGYPLDVVWPEAPK
jgi:hypothetical protein